MAGDCSCGIVGIWRENGVRNGGKMEVKMAGKDGDKVVKCSYCCLLPREKAMKGGGALGMVSKDFI